MKHWKKIENQTGLPLYVNEITKEKQWDHPKFSNLRQRLDECNYVKYSTYRVALKFRILQKSFWMDNVPLTVVAAVFERHKLGANECGLNLDCYDIEAIIHDILFACNKQRQITSDVDESTDLMLNLILNIFDRDKTGKVPVLASKLLLGILSNYTLTDLYKYLFELSADHNNCITRLKLQILLKKITEIIDFMHEDANFGQHMITSSTESCFHDSPGLVGITENSFITWLETGPSIVSWLGILSRIKLAETVIHNKACSSCKMKPFVGLRYRCLKCSNYIQCQHCFFTGKRTNSHKLSHSMREYCAEDNKKSQNIFVKKLLQFISCSTSEKSKLTLNNTNLLGTKNEMFDDNNDDGDDDDDDDDDDAKNDNSQIFSPLSQLQIIIRQLEYQNRELNSIISSGNHNAEQIRIHLENHKCKISTQINKLKVLKEYMKLPQPKNQIESTPMAPTSGLSRIKQLEILSPIQQTNEELTYTPSKIEINSQNINLHAEEPSSLQYSLNDISSWIGNNPKNCQNYIVDKREISIPKIHSDLDDALAKLQQILANNYVLDESLGSFDNGQLKYAVSEVEGMLTSFIDTVETSRSNSAQPNSIQTNKF